MIDKIFIGLLVLSCVGCGDDSSIDAGVDLSALADLAGADLVTPFDLVTSPDLEPTVTSVAISPGSTSVLVGDVVKLTATAMYSDASMKDVTPSAMWTSNTPSVLPITAGQGTVATAGSTMITAAVGGITSASVTITARSVVSVTLSWPGGGAQPATQENVNIQLTATAHLSDSTTLDVTSDPRVMWVSTTTSIATINGSGLAMPGNNAGTTGITAAFGGVTSASATLLVTP